MITARCFDVFGLSDLDFQIPFHAHHSPHPRSPTETSPHLYAAPQPGHFKFQVGTKVSGNFTDEKQSLTWSIPATVSKLLHEFPPKFLSLVDPCPYYWSSQMEEGLKVSLGKYRTLTAIHPQRVPATCPRSITITVIQKLSPVPSPTQVADSSLSSSATRQKRLKDVLPLHLGEKSLPN